MWGMIAIPAMAENHWKRPLLAIATHAGLSATVIAFEMLLKALLVWGTSKGAMRLEEAAVVEQILSYFIIFINTARSK